jgi:hypothetical protein
MATLAEDGIQFPDLTRPAVNPWFIAFTVMLATFMEVLDTSIAMLAFIDVFWILGVLCLVMVPLMFFIKSAPCSHETVSGH